MKAPTASRAPVFLALVFLVAGLALSAILTSRQMDSLHDGVPSVERTGLIVCAIGVIAGLFGLGWSWTQRANSNRRIALVVYAFTTLLLLVQIYNLATQ